MVFRKIAKKILSKSPKAYAAAHTLNFERTHRQDFSKLKEDEQELLTQVQQHGYAVIPNFFEKTQINQHLVDHFSLLINPPKIQKINSRI